MGGSYRSPAGVPEQLRARRDRMRNRRDDGAVTIVVRRPNGQGAGAPGGVTADLRDAKRAGRDRDRLDRARCRRPAARDPAAGQGGRAPEGTDPGLTRRRFRRLPGDETTGRRGPGCRHRGDDRDLLARGRRPAAPTALPRARSADVPGRGGAGTRWRVAPRDKLTIASAPPD